MPRSIIIGNGSLLATFDENLEMRDLYYPYVGMEDHTEYGDRHRVGIWMEGKGMHWFSGDSWDISIQYRSETMVTNSTMRNETLGIKMRIEDFVHPVYNILIRQFFINSLDNQPKNIRVFFHHDLHIYGDKQKDTAFYEPYTNSVIHYRQKRYFLIGGQTSEPTECVTGIKGEKNGSILQSFEHLQSCGISSFSVGKAEYQGLEGTWRDAEDGELSRHSIEQGSVDSTVGLHCSVHPEKETNVTMWMCAGKTLEEVLNLQETVLQEGRERMHRNCSNYWRSWVNKEHRDFGSLSPELIDLYKRSLLLIRMHCDNSGGMIAAADSDIMAFNRDTYTYVWPRDGGFVSLALDAAGYLEVTRRFYEFCATVQTPDGYMLHKYNPDASIGSSWHPWFRDGKPQLPIQEDETALVIYAMSKHFDIVQDFEFIQHMYENFVKKAGKFMVDFREEETGLPLASYDPWEEHKGVFTYTTACTIAGLQAASHIANVLGHHTHAELYYMVADKMRQALLFHLYDEEAGRFVKKIKRENGQTTERDLTPDASIAVIWKLGIVPVDDPRVVSTMKQLREHLTVHTDVGGLARYVNDYYHAKQDPSPQVPGNPWIITTLWAAQYDIARAQTLEDLESARQTLEWVRRYANTSGILAEQLHPHTGEQLSVAPLTWSHATFVDTVLQFVEKEHSLTNTPHA